MRRFLDDMNRNREREANRDSTAVFFLLLIGATAIGLIPPATFGVIFGIACGIPLAIYGAVLIGRGIKAFFRKRKERKIFKEPIIDQKSSSLDLHEEVNPIKDLASKGECSAEDLLLLLKDVSDRDVVNIINTFMITHQTTRDDLALFLKNGFDNNNNNDFDNNQAKGSIINCFLSNNKKFELSDMDDKARIVNDIIKNSNLQYNADVVTLIYKYILGSSTIYTPSISSALEDLYPSIEWKLEGPIEIGNLYRMIEIAIKEEKLQQKSSVLNIDGMHKVTEVGANRLEQRQTSSLNPHDLEMQNKRDAIERRWRAREELNPWGTAKWWHEQMTTEAETRSRLEQVTNQDRENGKRKVSIVENFSGVLFKR